MPEEINRIATDLISDLLLTPSSDADIHLREEGISPHRIRRVGNVMIDSLCLALKQIESSRNRKPTSSYALMTFHRPANVDTRKGLLQLAQFLQEASKVLPILLPLHPRTRKNLQEWNFLKRISRLPDLNISEPLGYFDFVHTMKEAQVVVTDSGGIQEETSFLGIPCLVMRTSTERPICIHRGTTELMGDNYDLALKRLRKIRDEPRKQPKRIPLWDGRTAGRIVSALCQHFPK
jgi:UDP-N-acetylglucosamine 2-epimerase (non-hydrolysing)